MESGGQVNCVIADGLSMAMGMGLINELMIICFMGIMAGLDVDVDSFCQVGL